jgi:hypothetical protein
MTAYYTILHKISRLKKTILGIMVMFFALFAHSQTKLSFCTFVNNQTQECVFENTKFITTPDSTHARLFMMIQSSATFDTTRLTFKIYSIDRFGKEVFVNSVLQDVQLDWRTAWQPAVFITPGKYVVKVYRDEEHVITGGGFELFNN